MVLKNSDYFRGSIWVSFLGALFGSDLDGLLGALFGSTWVGLFWDLTIVFLTRVAQNPTFGCPVFGEKRVRFLAKKGSDFWPDLGVLFGCGFGDLSDGQKGSFSGRLEKQQKWCFLKNGVFRQKVSFFQKKSGCGKVFLATNWGASILQCKKRVFLTNVDLWT